MSYGQKMNTNHDIQYKQLIIDDVREGLLDYFNRFQEVKKVWRIIENKKVLIEHPFTEEMDKREKNALIMGHFAECIREGGCVFVALYQNNVIAFATLPYAFFGSRNQYVNIAEFYTSYEFRGYGIGKNLFAQCAEQGKKWGAEKLYISSHSAEETVAFYRSVGCVDAIEINQRLAEKEPYDIQMEYSLY